MTEETSRYRTSSQMIKERSVLERVSVEAVLNQFLSEVTVTQSYRNTGEKNIEAVFTFPLPVRSVLLGLRAEIGGRFLRGVVLGKEAAETRYEDGISDGDLPVMLEPAAPGLYTMNLGNLRPGERAVISFTYAELLRWQDDGLRFFLPASVTPRQGDPEAAGLEPHQVPEHNYFADNRFRIRLRLKGIFKSADLASPTHEISVTREPGQAVVTLREGDAPMDRDFVCVLKQDVAAKNRAIIESSASGVTVLASCQPCFLQGKPLQPRNIVLAVDCSSSMNGDPLRQAKQALDASLSLLRPRDEMNIIAFGSGHKTLFHSPTPATKGNIAKARRFVRHLTADMGGKNLDDAIATAVHSYREQREVFIITDGGVWECRKAISKAVEVDSRIFCLGVGSAINEGLLRQLAEETGGFYEFATPNEQIAARTERLFDRLYQPRTATVKVRWPGSPERQIWCPRRPVFSGDMLHLFATYALQPAGDVVVDILLEDGQRFQTAVALQGAEEYQPQESCGQGLLARLARYQEMTAEFNWKKKGEICLEYQLLAATTRYVLVNMRGPDGRIRELPELRKAASMLPAGWGGTGGVHEPRIMFSREPRKVHEELPEEKSFLAEVTSCFGNDACPARPITSLDQLAEMGLGAGLIRVFAGLMSQGHREEDIVPLFLYLLSRKSFGFFFPRRVTLGIRSQYRRPVDYRTLSARLKVLMKEYRSHWQ